MREARAWFEIKRFFDAEPRSHYESADAEEWKTGIGRKAKEVLESGVKVFLQVRCASLSTVGTFAWVKESGVSPV